MIAAKSARPRFRCGVLGVVLQNGVVTIGDRVRVELPPAPWRDLPTQPSLKIRKRPAQTTRGNIPCRRPL
jgi:MOSC domain-containing protein YiiM